VYSPFSGGCPCQPVACWGRYAARKPLTHPCPNASCHTAPAVLAAGATRYPVGARRRRLPRGRCEDQSRATTASGSLGCAHNATFRPALRSLRNGGPAPLRGTSLLRRARDAARAARRGARAQARVPFFHAARTVFGLMCHTRTVSHMPLAFMALSTICCLTSGD
jgi:hypothetical protein